LNTQLELYAKPRKISSRLLGAFGEKKSEIVLSVRCGLCRNSTCHGSSTFGYFIRGFVISQADDFVGQHCLQYFISRNITVQVEKNVS